jgi:hypothetical protein
VSTADTAYVRLYEAAGDLGRLRRHIDPEPGGLLEWRLDLLAGHIEALIGMCEPTAAELVATTYPGDDETALAALDHVDRRHGRLRTLLGFKQAA